MSRHETAKDYNVIINFEFFFGNYNFLYSNFGMNVMYVKHEC